MFFLHNEFIRTLDHNPCKYCIIPIIVQISLFSSIYTNCPLYLIWIGLRFEWCLISAFSSWNGMCEFVSLKGKKKRGKKHFLGQIFHFFFTFQHFPYKNWILYVLKKKKKKRKRDLDTVELKVYLKLSSWLFNLDFVKRENSETKDEIIVSSEELNCEFKLKTKALWRISFQKCLKS